MDKIPESKAHFSPIIEVDGETFFVELTEYRDYFVLSVKVDENKVVAVPGFHIEKMQEKLLHNIRYYFDQQK